MKGAKGKILITNIYETGIDFYKYVCANEEKNFKLYGIIYKIE
jgi:hypothetical protein